MAVSKAVRNLLILLNKKLCVMEWLGPGRWERALSWFYRTACHQLATGSIRRVSREDAGGGRGAHDRAPPQGLGWPQSCRKAGPAGKCVEAGAHSGPALR